MKNLITILILFVAVGCGKSDIQRLEEKNNKLEAELKEEKHKLDLASKKLKHEKELEEIDLFKKVVGSYELKFGETTIKFVFLENRKLQGFLPKGLEKEKIEGTWKLVEKEVHVVEEGQSSTAVFKIEPNGDLIFFARIDSEGKRTDFPKDEQETYKKLKE